MEGPISSITLRRVWTSLSRATPARSAPWRDQPLPIITMLEKLYMIGTLPFVEFFMVRR